LVVVLRVLLVPSCEGVDSDGFGLSLILRPVLRFVAFPKDVNAPSLWICRVDMSEFNNGARLDLRVVNGSEVSVNCKFVFSEGSH